MLVGEVDFLSHPIIAFVRLATSQVLGDLTEIPIPTRFLFILLGPKGNQERFHEIGRSIATLMSDEVCVHVLYQRGEYSEPIHCGYHLVGISHCGVLISGVIFVHFCM